MSKRIQKCFRSDSSVGSDFETNDHSNGYGTNISFDRSDGFVSPQSGYLSENRIRAGSNAKPTGSFLDFLSGKDVIFSIPGQDASESHQFTGSPVNTGTSLNEVLMASRNNDWFRMSSCEKTQAETPKKPAGPKISKDKMKTELCSSWVKSGTCRYGKKVRHSSIFFKKLNNLVFDLMNSAASLMGQASSKTRP